MHQRSTKSARSLLGFSAAALLALAAGCSGSDTTDSGTDVAMVRGNLQIAVVGNLEIQRAHFEYFVEDSRGEWIQLVFDQRPDLLDGEHEHEQLSLPGVSHGASHSGMSIVAAGVREGSRLHVQELAVTGHHSEEISSTSEALIAASPRKVAVILANFSNNTSQPITPAAARDLVFGGTQSANAYFKEVSFGIRSLVGKTATTGDVYGWYTIAASNNPCDYSAWGSAARSAAQQAGVDLTGYDHIIHYFPQSSACAWSGVGQVPGKYTWINGSGSQTIAHELGHNFGSHHAGSLSCTNASGTRVTLSSTCTMREYGNPFDVMGSGYRHMTAFNKGRIGFLEPTNTQAVQADGTFTVVPLEKKATGVQALRIPISTTTAYYVEFRQPFGFDNFSATSSTVNGVLITRAPIAYTTLDIPVLLDQTPGTTSFSDAALTVGKTFTDSSARVSITVNSVSATGASVTIDMP